MSGGGNKVMLARSYTDLQTQVHEISPGSGRKIAFKRLDRAKGKPTIVLVPGHHDKFGMNGARQKALLRYCYMNELNMVVYDHEGVGSSSSSDNSKVLFSHWVEDCMTVIDELTGDRPVILLGSSLGAWISLHAAQEYADKEEKQIPGWMEEMAAKGEEVYKEDFASKIHGLVLCSPAMNHMMSYYTKQSQELPEDVKAKLDAGDSYFHTHPKFGQALLKKDLAEESLKYHIDFDKTIKIPDCPVKILTSLNDDLVNSEEFKKLTNSLSTDDVEIVYRKSSNHLMDGITDFEVLLNQLHRLIMDNPIKGEEELKEEDELIESISKEVPKDDIKMTNSRQM